MILLLPLHRPKQVYGFHTKMIPKMKQHIYNAVYPDTEQKLGLTKVRPYLFLMLINLIAPALTVPNRTVIP